MICTREAPSTHDRAAVSPDHYLKYYSTPIWASDSPCAAKNSGNRPQTIPSLRLLTSPAWLTADSARSRQLTWTKTWRKGAARAPAGALSALEGARDAPGYITERGTPSRHSCWAY